MNEKRILLADDDGALREMLAMTLEMEGCHVVQAADAETTISALEEGAFDILLLDMGMPPHEHDIQEGLRVLEWLQEHPRDLKCIVLTGQDPERSAYRAIKAGAFDYLSKPVEENALLQAVERAGLFLDNERRLRQEEQTQKVTLTLPLGQGVKPARNMAEEQLLRQVLEETGFNIHETARALNMNRENVYYLLKKYGIRRPSS